MPYKGSDYVTSFNQMHLLSSGRKIHTGESLRSAVNVGNLLLLTLAFGIIREFTAEKGFMSAVNVGNLFLLAVAFGIIREFICLD